MGVTVSPLLGSTKTSDSNDENSRREDDDIMISQESRHSSDDNDDLSDDMARDINNDVDENGVLVEIPFSTPPLTQSLEEEERIERIVSMNEVKKSFIKGMRDVVATNSVSLDGSLDGSLDDSLDGEGVSSRFVDTMDGN